MVSLPKSPFSLPEAFWVSCLIVLLSVSKQFIPRRVKPQNLVSRLCIISVFRILFPQVLSYLTRKSGFCLPVHMILSKALLDFLFSLLEFSASSPTLKEGKEACRMLVWFLLPEVFAPRCLTALIAPSCLSMDMICACIWLPQLFLSYLLIYIIASKWCPPLN